MPKLMPIPTEERLSDIELFALWATAECLKLVKLEDGTFARKPWEENISRAARELIDRRTGDGTWTLVPEPESPGTV